MYFVINKKVYTLERVVTLLSFLAGFIFFVGQTYHLFSNLKIDIWLSNLQKITFQSNLFAFIIGSIYLMNPKHPIFRNNLALLLATIFLLFAGLGFWVLLFPLYFIDLSNFLIRFEHVGSYNFAIFFVFWNHTVTQILFLMMFCFSVKRSCNYFMAPIDKKTLNGYIVGYMFFWIILNIFNSFWDVHFPTYGIMTNFNPNTRYTAQSTNTILFDFRVLFVSHILSFSLLFFTSNYLDSISRNFFANNSYEFLKKKGLEQNLY